MLELENALIVEVVNSFKKWSSQDLKVLAINKENINDALWFNTQEEINQFQHFIDKGYLGFYCYKNGICIFRTFIFTKSEKAMVGKHFAYHLKENEVFSAWNQTAKEYRGLGVYSFTLNQLIHMFPDKHFSAFVSADNHSSIKGMKKAGFEITRRLILMKLSRLKIYIQYKGPNNKWCFRLGIGSIINK